MGSTFTLVWFVLAQIFVYSSTDTCRHSSPHLWWLTFGVLSVMYLMILEVVLVAILVFVVGPILFVRFKISYLDPTVRLTPRSCSGAFSFSALDDIHHKILITSRPILGNSHARSLKKSLWCFTSLHHRTNRRNRSQSHLTCTRTRLNRQILLAAFTSSDEGPHPRAV